MSPISDQIMQWLTYALPFTLYLLAGGAGALCAAATFAIALDTVWRRVRRRRGEQGSRSAIYSGHVWHARFKPTHHAFSYPVFYCLLDLDEIELAMHGFMWPVASVRWLAFAQFRASDHLKPPTAMKRAASAAAGSRGVFGLSDRVRDMVQEATGALLIGEGLKVQVAALAAVHACPAPRVVVLEGRIQLLTHLAYWGYCFNPVSFYYCLDDSERKIETMVGEVSNTPWGEMHCYVLNPKSDGVEVLAGEDSTKVRYRFEKDFHVSPFMSMKHVYDWRFNPPLAENGSRLFAQTTLLEPVDGAGRGVNPGADPPKVFFDAKLVLRRCEFTAASLLWHMMMYPLFTVWVQLLIHFEAFRLWYKKVPYYPHPTGYETASSKLIGMLMVPLFSIQEVWQARRRGRRHVE